MPPGKRIVSWKFTQFNEVNIDTAKAYIREARGKYIEGAGIVQDVTSSQRYPGLVGKPLRGDLHLEVPVQTGDLNSAQFQEILRYANGAGVVPPLGQKIRHVFIVDEVGKYNP